MYSVGSIFSFMTYTAANGMHRRNHWMILLLYYTEIYIYLAPYCTSKVSKTVKYGISRFFPNSHSFFHSRKFFESKYFKKSQVGKSVSGLARFNNNKHLKHHSCAACSTGCCCCCCVAVSGNTLPHTFHLPYLLTICRSNTT